VFWFSLPFSLLLPHNHFRVLEVFPLQIKLVSDLDAWDDFLDIPKKVFNSLPLYQVQKTQKIVKLLKEYLMNHLTSLPYYLISLFSYLFYQSFVFLQGWFFHLFTLFLCIFILSFLHGWFYHLITLSLLHIYLFYHSLAFLQGRFYHLITLSLLYIYLYFIIDLHSYKVGYDVNPVKNNETQQ
jgi:hypothetical protein